MSLNKPLSMNLQKFIAANNVNLTNCDGELIHIPGCIQPHGILLVLCEPDLEILHISNNTETWLGVEAEKLLGQHLSNLLEPDRIAAIQAYLHRDVESIIPLKLKVKSSQGKFATFNGVIHRSQQNYLILELEPFNPEQVSNYVTFYTEIQVTLTEMQQLSNLSALSALMVKEVKKITGFDRVIVYQFGSDGSGSVIAEDKSEELESYLGLHYSDFDIPQQARYLYALNPLRLIPDVNYQPVAIISKGASPPSPLDLSFCVLRSVSPIHIEYLKNMGVRASMSILLLKNKKLWGLIACLHQTPRFVPYEIRTVCEFLAKMMSLELADKEENENLDYKLQLKSLQTKFMDTFVGILIRKADELTAINLELERSNNELDAFSYIASHELKEPLRGIHNYSTFLLEDYGNILDRSGVSKLETLVRLTKRMEDLINSLQHFSRLGRQELNMQIINFNELVNNVSEVFRINLGNANIDIRIPKLLPMIRGDRVLLEFVLTNLIGNGFKYNDSPEKWVEVGYLESPGQPIWTFYVRDNGIGIREKHLETIFGIFKRLHPLYKYNGGTGVGLTIAKKIIERHDGKIWVESTYGEGSTFYFTLPRSEDMNHDG